MEHRSALSTRLERTECRRRWKHFAELLGRQHLPLTDLPAATEMIAAGAQVVGVVDRQDALESLRREAVGSDLLNRGVLPSARGEIRVAWLDTVAAYTPTPRRPAPPG